MEIKEVKDTIIRWAKGCNTIEQVEALEKFTQETFPVLFEKKESELVIDLAKGELLDAMFFQRAMINDIYENLLA